MWRRRTACIAMVALANLAHAQPAASTSAPDRSTADKVPSGPDRPSIADSQRLTDLVALIDGQNSPAARLTGARELLRIGSPDAVRRLSAVLAGTNRPARIAVANALAETSMIDGAFLAPLIALLSDEDADARQAAAAALAKSGTPGIARLSDLLNDPQTGQSAKLAAIDALGRMTQREAIALLVAALADPASPLCRSALEALERATAQDFNDDLAAAQRWWEETRGVDPTVWHQIQIDRLVRQSGQLGQRVRELETRLSTVLREHFFRAPDADRAAVLNGYLTDASDVVRLLGLELVQSQITEGKPPAPETAAKARELFAAGEPRIRAAAIRTVASLRDRSDAERFAQRLSIETEQSVRLAIIYGLGYVGGPESVPVVLATLSDADTATSDEAITALGRIAERPGLDSAARDRIATALLERWNAGGAAAPAHRERLVRAMSRVADRRFATIFVDSLGVSEPSGVRLAAVRGLSVLLDPRLDETGGASTSAPSGDNSDAARKPLVDAVHRAVADGDASVRKAAVEAIGGFAANDAHLAILWTRLAPAQEPDETVRTLAWRGALRMYSGRSIAEIEAAIDRLPDNGPIRAARAVELLLLAEKQAVAATMPRGELGRIRARIAAQRAQLSQPAEAVAAYCAAIDDLGADQSPDAHRVLVELLRFAITSEKCDLAVPRIAKLNGDYSAAWREIRDELQGLIRRESIDKALAALVAFQAGPPALGADAKIEIEQWLRRARELRGELDSQQVAAAVDALQANPADEAARTAIAQLGARAVPGIRTALRTTLSADSANPALERALHDLLRLCLPEWPGFTPDASIADKIKALDRISA